MEEINTKLRIVFLPFVCILGAILFGYCFLRWVLDVKLGLLPLKQELLDFWIPFALPWIPVWVWTRNRVEILKVRGQDENGYSAYRAAMSFAIIFPLIVSQDYISKGTYGLNEISTVEQVKRLPGEKYFKIDRFSVNRNETLAHPVVRTPSRTGNNLSFSLYIACQFEQDESIWYGVKYFDGISDSESDAAKEVAFDAFLSISENRLKTYSFQTVTYFEKLSHSDDRDGYLDAIEGSPRDIRRDDQIVLVPGSGEFEQRSGHSLVRTLGSVFIANAVILSMVLIPGIDPIRLDNFLNGRVSREDSLRDLTQFLSLRGQFKGTSVLIGLNVTAFLGLAVVGVSITSPTAMDLLEFGGHRRAEVIGGSYWRLFSSIFVHAGLMHLLANLVGLSLGGIFLERVVGAKRLIIIYLICGGLASLTSVYWHESTVTVGASGAIYGIYGVILSFAILRIYPKQLKTAILILVGSFAGVGLLFGIAGNIDNAAHIGGLISGLLGGLLVGVFNKRKFTKTAEQMNF